MTDNATVEDPVTDFGIYLVTDADLCAPRSTAQVVKAAVDAGVRTVQLRAKNANSADVLREAEALATVIDGRALLLINDDVEATRTARERGLPVDGVHVGQGDTPPERARELLGPDALIGLSANTAAHLEAVHALPAGTLDYLGVGAIAATTTKADHPPALGVQGFARIAASAQPLPCVAIGGITAADVAPLRAAGAAGIAVVSAICAADDPFAASRELVQRWDSASGTSSHP